MATLWSYVSTMLTELIIGKLSTWPDRLRLRWCHRNRNWLFSSTWLPGLPQQASWLSRSNALTLIVGMPQSGDVSHLPLVLHSAWRKMMEMLR